MTRRDELIDAPTDNLRKRTLTGTAMVGTSQAVKVAVQFVSVVLIARLLSPEDIGLFAMVLPFVAFIGLFQDLGLTQAITTAKVLTHSQASVMFWLNLGLSLLLFLVLSALAPAIAAFYERPEVTALTLGLAMTFLLSGLVTMQIALLNRAMRFGALAAIEIASSIAGVAAAVAVALIYPSPWALLSATVVSLAVSVIMAWRLSSWRPQRAANLKEVSELLRFGAGVTGFNITNFFARSLDNVLIGRFSGATQLGYYDRAYKLLIMPLQQVNRPIGRVLIPALSRLVDEPHRYKHAYLRVVQQTMLLIIPGVITLMITAQHFIPLLMGSQWAPSSVIFAWLALSGLHQPLTTTIGWLFISQGRTTEFAKWGLVNAAVCIAAFIVGLPDGAVGVARSYALADTFILAPAVWYVIGRKGPVRTWDLVALAKPYAIAGTGAAAVVLALVRLLPSESVLASGWVLIILCGMVCYAAFGTALLLTKSGREILEETAKLARSGLQAARLVS